MPESPRGRTKRPYVRTEDLAVLIEGWLARHEEEGENPHSLARRAGLSARAVTKILRRETPLQTAWVADALLICIDRSLAFDIEVLELAGVSTKTPASELGCEMALSAGGVI